MTGEPTYESPNGGGAFFPGDMPEGLDCIIADIGCARHQMLGYRLGYQQVWPPTTLPAGSLGVDNIKEDERERVPVNNTSPNVEAADETAAEILSRMWKDPRERHQLIAAGSADRIAQLIGKGATVVKQAGIIWDENIKPALAAARYAAKIEREERRRKGRS